jgi:hypothetical protein
MLETLHAYVECQGRWFGKDRNEMIVDTVLRCGKAAYPLMKRQATVFPYASRGRSPREHFLPQGNRRFLSKI